MGRGGRPRRALSPGPAGAPAPELPQSVGVKAARMRESRTLQEAVVRRRCDGMWRRRRDQGRAGAMRTVDSMPGGSGTGSPGAGPGGEGGGRGGWGRGGGRVLSRIHGRLSGRGRNAWRVDRRGAARVAWTPPAEFPRRTTQADMVPAPTPWPANGRLGRDMPSVYCIRCGQENPEGARFCSQCGTPLARGSGEGATETTSIISLGGDLGDAEFGDESVADAATLDTLPAGTALLVVR